jgi:cell division protein FtsQ
MILGFIVLISLVSFSVIHNAARPVNNLEINFLAENPNYFLNEDIIKEIIKEESNDVMNLPLSEVDVKKIEDIIDENPYIDSVQVNKDVRGTIFFDIKTNVPIARLATPKGEFYLSTKGKKMPLSKLNSATVVLVSGDVKEDEYEELSNFIATINSDELLKNHIIGIEKVGKKSYNLIVNRGNFFIEFGTLNNYERKLKNLKLFYEQYIDFVGTEDYEKINLKFINQVVATKRTLHNEQ